MKNEISHRVRSVAVCFFALFGLAAALRILFFRIAAVNMVTYDVRVVRECFPLFWCLFAGIPALLFLHPAVSLSTVKKTASAGAPFLLGFLLPQENFWFFPGFLGLLGWGLLRLVRVYGGGFCRNFLRTEFSDPGARFYPWILLAVYGLAVGWGYYLQIQSARTLFISYADWGIYAESGLRLSSGSASWREWLSTGSHWNPLANVVIALFVRLFPFQEALFLFNSLLIYSVIPLAWWFARRIGLRPFHAFCLDLGAGLCPVYGNLSLSLFYGFRPIFFAIPLLMLFFMFQRTGCRTGMILCCAATLLLKETMMIFWFGYGLWLLIRRRWRVGALLAAGCLAGFFLLSGWVLPRLVNTEVYPLTFLYSTLGSSPAEVIRSPFSKPEAFLAVCFQWQNFVFAATLLVPFFFCAWLFPDLMIAVLPLLAGICLRGSPEIKSIALWYGLETTTLLLALSIINLDRIRCGENSVWLRIVLAGLPRRCPRVLLITAMAVSLTGVMAAAHYCFALTLWGKYSFQAVREMPDWTAVIETIRGKIPPGARVLASERLRNQFMYQHPTADFSWPRHPGDYLVLALHDRKMDSAEKLELIRRQIAFDPRVVPLDSFVLSGRHIVLFKVAAAAEKGPVARPQVIPAEKFAAFGVPVPSASRDFAIRYGFRNNRHIFLIRLNHVPEYDIDFICELEGEWGKLRSVHSFGWGLFPAYACPEGSVFPVEVEAPPARNIRCLCSERKASRLNPAR